MGHLVPDPPPPPRVYRCGHCGAMQPSTALYCTQCGSPALIPIILDDPPKKKPPVMPKPDNGTDKK